MNIPNCFLSPWLYTCCPSNKKTLSALVFHWHFWLLIFVALYICLPHWTEFLKFSLYSLAPYQTHSKGLESIFGMNEWTHKWMDGYYHSQRLTPGPLAFLLLLHVYNQVKIKGLSKQCHEAIVSDISNVYCFPMVTHRNDCPSLLPLC